MQRYTFAVLIFGGAIAVFVGGYLLIAYLSGAAPFGDDGTVLSPSPRAQPSLSHAQPSPRQETSGYVTCDATSEPSSGKCGRVTQAWLADTRWKLQDRSLGSLVNISCHCGVGKCFNAGNVYDRYMCGGSQCRPDDLLPALQTFAPLTTSEHPNLQISKECKTYIAPTSVAIENQTNEKLSVSFYASGDDYLNEQQALNRTTKAYKIMNFRVADDNPFGGSLTLGKAGQSIISSIVQEAVWDSVDLVTDFIIGQEIGMIVNLVYQFSERLVSRIIRQRYELDDPTVNLYWNASQWGYGHMQSFDQVRMIPWQSVWMPTGVMTATLQPVPVTNAPALLPYGVAKQSNDVAQGSPEVYAMKSGADETATHVAVLYSGDTVWNVSKLDAPCDPNGVVHLPWVASIAAWRLMRRDELNWGYIPVTEPYRPVVPGFQPSVGLFANVKRTTISVINASGNDGYLAVFYDHPEGANRAAMRNQSLNGSTIDLEVRTGSITVGLVANDGKRALSDQLMITRPMLISGQTLTLGPAKDFDSLGRNFIVIKRVSDEVPGNPNNPDSYLQVETDTVLYAGTVDSETYYVIKPTVDSPKDHNQQMGYQLYPRGYFRNGINV